VKRYRTFAIAALSFCAIPALAQVRATVQNVPELNYRAVPGFFKPPAGDYPGETQGVATNSKGDVFVFFRAERSRLWEYDKTGKFVREIGKGFYNFLFAHSVRVDAHDNIWTVDEGSNTVTKFSPDGSKVLMVIGFRPPVTAGVVATVRGPNPPDQNYTLCRPTDVAFDSKGDIFISDGYCNNRVLKYDPNGRFLAKVGGSAPGKGVNQFNLPHALQVDRAGNVYVAVRGNARYVVLDNDLHWKTTYTNYGSAWSDCISQGPHQYLFVSNSNPNGNAPGTWDTTGQIYKLEPNWQVVHMMDCRNPNALIVGEIESWRAQKFVLQPK
jgi:sugar lactone lactonase YvrE